VRGGSGSKQYRLIAAHGNRGIIDVMDDPCPECARLRADRDELLHRLDAPEERHAEILRLVDRRYRFSAVVEQELMQRLGLTTPTRN
jgi:hypothetical protein